jgi:hypothetical protein
MKLKWPPSNWPFKLRYIMNPVNSARLAGGSESPMEYCTIIVVGISLLQLAILVEVGEASQIVAVSNTQTPISRFPTAWKLPILRNLPEQDAERVSGVSRYRSAELDRTIRCIPAAIVFDSSRQTSLAGSRGVLAPARTLVLQTEDFDIHLQICREREHRHILGQILSRSRIDFANARLHLLRNGEKLQAATADTLGEFNFTKVPEGDLNLQVEFPDLTIVGALSG